MAPAAAAGQFCVKRLSSLDSMKLHQAYLVSVESRASNSSGYSIGNVFEGAPLITSNIGMLHRDGEDLGFSDNASDVLRAEIIWSYFTPCRMLRHSSIEIGLPVTQLDHFGISHDSALFFPWAYAQCMLRAATYADNALCAWYKNLSFFEKWFSEGVTPDWRGPAMMRMFEQIKSILNGER